MNDVIKAFLSVGIIVLLSSIQPIKALGQSTVFTDADRLIQILRSEQILNGDQQTAIKKILASDKLFTGSPDTLGDVLEALDQKVQRDLDILNATVMNLSRLHENRYARRAANFKGYDLQACINMKEALTLAISKSDSLLTKYRVAMTAEDYQTSMERKVRFLFDDEDPVTVPALWKFIREKSKEVYPDWNRKFQELTRRNKVQIRSKGGMDAYPPPHDFDEDEFMRLFNDLQSQLRQLSEADSKEF